MTTFISKKNLLLLLVIIVILLLAYFLIPVSLPIIFALLTAIILNPAIDGIRNRLPMKRTSAVIIVFTLFILFIGISLYFLTTKVVTQALLFIENLPFYLSKLNRAFIEFQTNFDNRYSDLPPELLYEINSQINQTLINIRNDLANRNLIKDITNIISKIPGYFITFLVYIIALFLFMIELPRLKKQLFSYFTESTADKVNFMVSRLTYVIVGFCKGQFLVSIIIFIVSLIGLLIITPDVALLMSFIIWIIDIIPIIGSIVILAPWALYHFITGNISLGTELLILAAILIIIRRTVEPKIMGQQIGLSPLATLIAMYLGLMFFGVIGFFLGPLVVILFTSAKEAGIIKFQFKI